MRSLIVTVAGCSSRFNENCPEPVLKCIHTDGDMRKTLLFQILDKAGSCGQIIVVGGYKYEEEKQEAGCGRSDCRSGGGDVPHRRMGGNQ